MPISAIVNGNEITFRADVFVQDNTYFQLVDVSNTGISFLVNYPLKADSSFVGKNFRVYFLSKVDLKENEIFQFFDGSQNPPRRIGWCIPVNALDSIEHDYAENEHFLRYAYVGVLNAINTFDPNLFHKKVNLDLLYEAKLTDIFHESTAFLIISEETLPTKEFDIYRWLPSLAMYGYFSLTSTDPSQMLYRCESVKEKKLTFKPISEAIGNISYISTIYSKIIPFESNPIHQFFYLYQVIELLLEIIFRLEQDSLVEEIIAARGNVNAIKELLDKVNSNASEKKRISLMNSKYAQSNVNDLKDKCNRFLSSIGREEGQSIESYFYPVRNFLFHQYRDFPETAQPVLNEVVVSLINSLPDILSEFNNGGMAKQSE